MVFIKFIDMRKLLTFLLIILSFGVFSQKVEVRPSFGLNWNNFKEDLPMRENFNYMAGLSFNNYGHRFYFETGGYWTQIKNNDSAIRNQLRFPAKIGINVVDKDKKKFNLRFFAGPVAYITLEDNYVNLYANAGMGVDMFPFFINIGYDVGITEYQNIHVNNFYVKTGFIIMSRNKYYR
jgi:hypothetical protein